ncbi:MAG: hypothetical protein GY800_07205 [Planctomycetes bacterium]|nr:hypothetical protein [Planctomycetota bacterium]
MKIDKTAHRKLKDIIKYMFKNVGPETSLKDSPGTLYELENDIKYNQNYLLGGYLLKEEVLDIIPQLQKKINYLSSIAVFEEISKHIYNRITERSGVITKTLDNYLQEDDFDYGASKLLALLDSGYNTYNVILITDLLNLEDIKCVDFGKVLVKQIDETYINNLPGKLDNRVFGFAGILEKDIQVLSREDWFEKNKTSTSLEVNIEGYHLSRERSYVYDKALDEYRQVFSYLCMCEHFLSNVQRKYTMKTQQLSNIAFTGSNGPKGRQDYYIRKGADFKIIDMKYEAISVSDRIFVITNECLEQLNDRCYLHKFSTVYRDDTYGEIKHKIRRSFDWFWKAIYEKDPTDKVIDLFISLESLLSQGGDPLTSLTDDMAENVAIMLTSGTEKRYKEKMKFKKAYKLRCRIIHDGETIKEEKDWLTVMSVKNYVVWSSLGIIGRIDSILKHGNKSGAIRKYFELEKLK